jgi:DNA-binding MarR family transcriptional regulator
MAGAIHSRGPGRAGQARERRSQELGRQFRAVARALNRLRGRDTHLAVGEISHAQFQLLLELEEHGGEAATGELAAAARLAPATVTQMLDHLAESGHVERVRSAADRRVVVTRLTRRGRGRIEAKRAAWADRWEQALAGFDVGELAAATRVLERLAWMLEEGSSDRGLEGSGGSRKPAPKAVRAA